MKSFDNDLLNPFDDPNISDAKMDVFVTSLLTKIDSANVAGIFDTIKAAIEVPHTPYHTVMLKLASDRTGTRADTEFRVDVITDFTVFVRENYGPVKKMYKASHGILITFYAHGMKDFKNVNKTTALSLMTAYALAISTNHADWDVKDPDFVSVGEAFPARYEAALELQDDGKTGTGTDKVVRNTNRPLLNVAVFDAYNFMKYYYSCEPTAIKAVWADMQTLIPADSHDEIETNKGPIAHSATANMASGNYDATYWVLFRNLGTTKLKIGLQGNATEAAGAKSKTLKGGKSKSFQIITLGDTGKQFLNTTNLDLNDEGEWGIEIYTKE